MGAEFTLPTIDVMTTNHASQAVSVEMWDCLFAMEVANARSLGTLLPFTRLTGCQRRHTVDIGILATACDATAAPGRTGLLSLSLAVKCAYRDV